MYRSLAELAWKNRRSESSAEEELMPGRRLAPNDSLLDGGILKFILLNRKRVASFDEYPFDIPAIYHLEKLELHPKVTFFVGENGSGKSILDRLFSDDPETEP